MAAQTPSDAVHSYISRLRAAVRCVTDAEVLGSGHAVGSLIGVIVVARGKSPRNVVPLRLQSGRTGLFLGVFLQYTVIHLPGDPAQGPFRVMESRYLYEVMDREGRELFAYHWHPTGVSPVQRPHLHLTAVATLTLTPGPGRPQPIGLPVGMAHFPTGRVPIQDVISMLITDLAIEPRQSDWSTVLASS